MEVWKSISFLQFGMLFVFLSRTLLSGTTAYNIMLTIK